MTTMSAVRPRSATATAGHVEAALRKDLGTLPAELREGALAATCQVLARRIDAGMSARDAITAAKELRTTLGTLISQAPAREDGDVIDELRARRENRLSKVDDAQANSGTP
jgi:hypothetical protein